MLLQSSVFMALISFSWTTSIVLDKIQAEAKGGVIGARRSSPAERLTIVRNILSERGADAIVIPMSDAHLSLYVGPPDAHILWISDFTGSSGTVLVLHSSAGLWTDGRYTLQAIKELDFNHWTLRDTSIASTPSISAFLIEQFSVSGGKVIVNGELYSHTSFQTLKNNLAASNISLENDSTAVLEARRRLNENAPVREARDLNVMEFIDSGRTVMEKVTEVRQKMLEREAEAFVVSGLDSVAYLTNLRGADIPYNPVFFAYIILTDSNITVFEQPSRSDVTREQLVYLGIPAEQLDMKEYSTVFEHLKSISNSLKCEECREGKKIWVPHHYSQALYEAAKGDNNVEVITTVSPISIMKLTKNDHEVQGMIETHIKDGKALVRLLHHLQKLLEAGGTITEYEAGALANEFRRDEDGFFSPSFSSISGSGPNAAIIHYRPIPGEDRNISTKEIYLIDSGGQYTGGTTDVTRTVHYGKPTSNEILAYTLVLKGQIAVARSIIPYGARGIVLDPLARSALWSRGMNYPHGTGHGVGHRLNVHEGPIGIAQGSLADDPGFGPNMFVSDEPGYYNEGGYGIRIEDVIQSVTARAPRSGPGPRQDIKNSVYEILDFDGLGALAFRKTTLVPLALNLIDMDLLDQDEIDHVDSYHIRVNDVIGGRLRASGHVEAADWLAANTITLADFNGAITVTANIFLISFLAVVMILLH